MIKKALSQTNPYLKDPKLRAKIIRDNVISSTAIEGINLKLPEKAICYFRVTATNKYK